MKKLISTILFILIVFSGYLPVSKAAEQPLDFVDIKADFGFKSAILYGEFSFIDGFAWIGDAKYGRQASLVDRDGNLIFKNKFVMDAFGRSDHIHFSEGLSRVEVSSKPKKWAYIDTKGNEVIVIEADNVMNFQEGLAAFKKDGKWGFIDKDGDVRVRPQFEEISNSIRGIIVSEFGYGGFKDGLAAVKKSGKWGFINYRGDEVIPFKYDLALDFNEGLAAVKLDDKWGYIDKDGKVVIKSQFAEASSFNDGLAHIRKFGTNKYSFIDKSGKEVIKPNPEYEYFDDFREGMAIITKDGINDLYGFMDSTGEVIVKPKYNEVKSFSEGLARVYVEGKGYGYIDKSGKEIIKPQFTSASSFKDGIALVSVRVDDSRGASTRKILMNPLDKPDVWAKSEIEEAISLNLVPIEMKYGYKNNITRAEFSKLALNLLTVKTGKSIDTLLQERGVTINSNAFDDTQDNILLASNALGIVSGKSKGIFDPNGLITRQEAAVMLARTAKVLGIPENINSSVFSDSESIADWAKDAVSFVSAVEDNTNHAAVMGSTGGNKFSPYSNYQKQQAFITIKRLFNVK